VAKVVIPLKQEFVTELLPLVFLGDGEAIKAFQGTIAALVDVKYKNVRVTGAMQKAVRHRRRELMPMNIVIDYAIFIEVNDVTPANIERTVAVVAEKMLAPTFTTSLAAAMAKVPSLPVMVASVPIPPAMDQVTYEILRTPKPTPAPTILAEEVSNNGFLDGAGSKIGLGAGLAIVLLVSVYCKYCKKKGAFDNVRVICDTGQLDSDRGTTDSAPDDRSQPATLVAPYQQIPLQRASFDARANIESDTDHSRDEELCGMYDSKPATLVAPYQQIPLQRASFDARANIESDTDHSRDEELCGMYDSKPAAHVASTESTIRTSLKEKGVLMSAHMNMQSIEDRRPSKPAASGSGAKTPSLLEAGGFESEMHLNPLEVTASEQSVPRDASASR